MHLEQLEYLIQISKHKSFAAVSPIVHLTPQALSLSIKRLEEELQTSLLTRSNKGIYLTVEGKELVELSSRFFRDLTRFQNKKIFFLLPKILHSLFHKRNMVVFLCLFFAIFIDNILISISFQKRIQRI